MSAATESVSKNVFAYAKRLSRKEVEKIARDGHDWSDTAFFELNAMENDELVAWCRKELACET